MGQVLALATREVLAYTAGIIDGEGWIGITYDIRKDGNFHTLQISVSNSDEVLIKWLHRYFGGTTRRGKRPNRKPYYIWAISAAAAEAFLRKVYPFLVIKQNQADVVFEFRQTFAAPRCVISKKKHEFRHKCYLELRRLKHI